LYEEFFIGEIGTVLNIMKDRSGVSEYVIFKVKLVERLVCIGLNNYEYYKQLNKHSGSKVFLFIENDPRVEILETPYSYDDRVGKIWPIQMFAFKSIGDKRANTIEVSTKDVLKLRPVSSTMGSFEDYIDILGNVFD